MNLLEDLVNSLDSIKDYTVGVEVFEDGYRSEIHVYNRGALVTDKDTDF